jgi:hypothetical protein
MQKVELVAEEKAPWEEAVAVAEESFSAPAAAPAASSGDSASSRAQDILAAIRNRNK